MINRPSMGRMNYLSAGRPGMQRTRPVNTVANPVIRPTPGISAPPVYGGPPTPGMPGKGVQGPPIFAPGRRRL